MDLGLFISKNFACRIWINHRLIFRKNGDKSLYFSGDEMMKSREKAQKPVFPAYFRHFRPEMNFFLKIGLRHILGIAILHLCAKKHKKIMSQSREKLVTDARTNGRTNGQRLIYRTSEVGPKNRKFKLTLPLQTVREILQLR